MANNIDDGIGKLASNLTQKIISNRWYNIKLRIDTILMSGISEKDYYKSRCRELDMMTHNDRMNHVRQNWGAIYLDKVTPLLEQLDIIENSAN